MCAKSDYGRRASEGYTKAYGKAWLKAYGITCPDCDGTGVHSCLDDLGGDICTNSLCQRCNGVGFIEKEKE